MNPPGQHFANYPRPQDDDCLSILFEYYEAFPFPDCLDPVFVHFSDPTSATITFSSPVSDLYLITPNWFSGEDFNRHIYTFSSPFSIASGFAQANVENGNRLVFSAFVTQVGVLHFPGPLTTLNIDTALQSPFNPNFGTQLSSNAFTFGVM